MTKTIDSVAKTNPRSPWDGIYCGYGVATNLRIVRWSTPFLTRHQAKIKEKQDKPKTKKSSAKEPTKNGDNGNDKVNGKERHDESENGNIYF